MTKHLIVTGASGFIGRNLILAVPTDWEVVALYNSSLDFPTWVKQNNLPHVKAVRCDLSDEVDVHELAYRLGTSFDACVFLAANGDPTYSVEHPFSDLQTTVITLLYFLNHFEVGKFIYFSSGAVYDGLAGPVSPSVKVSPHLPYAITHWCCEHYVRAFAHQGRVGQYVNLRFFGAYGPYEHCRKLYTRLVCRFDIERIPQFSVRGDGNNYIDAMYIDDAVRGVLAVLESDQGNITVDFCSGAPMTVNELVQIAARTFGLKGLELEHAGQVPEYIKFSASNEEMSKRFHFCPRIPLEEGLQRLAEFLKHGKESACE